MKINYQLVSRSLIALLFVLSGLQKIGIGIFNYDVILNLIFSPASGLMKMGLYFNGTSSFISSLGIPMASLVTVLVIFIEIVVSVAFAYGYRLCITGMILIGFTSIATILVHNHIPADMIMILKNIAIIGGIMSAMTMCCCGKCPMGKSCGGCKDCKSDKKCEKCSVK